MDKIHWWTQGRVLTYPICGSKPNSEYEQTHRAATQSEVTCPECRVKLAHLKHSERPTKPKTSKTPKTPTMLYRIVRYVVLTILFMAATIIIQDRENADLSPSNQPSSTEKTTN